MPTCSLQNVMKRTYNFWNFFPAFFEWDKKGKRLIIDGKTARANIFVLALHSSHLFPFALHFLTPQPHRQSTWFANHAYLPLDYNSWNFYGCFEPGLQAPLGDESLRMNIRPHWNRMAVLYRHLIRRLTLIHPHAITVETGVRFWRLFSLFSSFLTSIQLVGTFFDN